MMRAAGRYGDGWFPGTTRADEYGEQLDMVRTAASDAGRDPMSITPALIRFIVTGRSRAEVDEVVDSDIAKIFTLNFPGEAWTRHGVEHPMGTDFTGVQDLIPQLIDEQTALSYSAKVPRSLVEELFAVGTPDEVVDQIAARQAVEGQRPIERGIVHAPGLLEKGEALIGYLIGRGQITSARLLQNELFIDQTLQRRFGIGR